MGIYDSHMVGKIFCLLICRYWVNLVATASGVCHAQGDVCDFRALLNPFAHGPQRAILCHACIIQVTISLIISLISMHSAEVASVRDMTMYHPGRPHSESSRSVILCTPTMTIMLPKCQVSHAFFPGIRIGEASNPGPCARVAIVNPTALTNKEAMFKHLVEQQVTMLACSETSATAPVQHSFGYFMRTLGFSSLWSSPVQPHKIKLDDTQGLRGKAAGVSLRTVFPCRKPWTIMSDWTSSVRLLHAVVRLGSLWIQVVVIYGFASDNHHAHSQTNALFQQAIQMTEQLPLPSMILGDYNLDVHLLEKFPLLHEKGFVSLQQLHEQRTGVPFPATCKGATSPDTAILHPVIASRVQSIWVDQDGLFDAHKPVFVDISIPAEQVLTPKIRFPDTWVQFGIQAQDLDHVWNQQYTSAPRAQDLEAWGMKVEAVVDDAMLRETQLHPELQLPKKLPRSCKGRCKPGKITMCPVIPLAKNSRHGNYAPPNEPLSFQTRRMLKQLRRVESLRQRVLKHERQPANQRIYAQLTDEWRVIQDCHMQGQCFQLWVQNIPELGAWLRAVPDSHWLFDLQQFIRMKLESLLYAERQMQSHLAKLKHRHDVKDGSSRQAFKTVKAQCNPIFQHPVIDLQELAIPVQTTDNVVQCYVAKAMDFVDTEPVFVDNIPGYLVHKDEFAIHIQLPPGHEVSQDTCQVHQKVHVLTPHATADVLTKYWSQFWMKDDPWITEDLCPPPETDPMCQLLWRVLPKVDWSTWICPHTLSNWKAAIKHIHVNSSPGVDAINFHELRMIPDQLLQELIDIVLALGAFPNWSMMARTVPLAKHQGELTPGDSRPITILGSIYRVWARVSCHAITQHMMGILPKEITGLLPGRGSNKASYDQQWALESAKKHQKSLQGVTLDLRKCYNLMLRSKISWVFQILGIPRDLVVMWFTSIQQLTRYWSLLDFASTPVHSMAVCAGNDQCVPMLDHDPPTPSKGCFSFGLC